MRDVDNVNIYALARFVAGEKMWPYWIKLFQHYAWIDGRAQLTETGRLALITWKLTA